ncbi:uncharacterized protein ColSpa_03477 [Colletotrichum spaethianum]|uniref:Uncharacterized protein n=1 Tax=Colletotrichum spaethianum TaxID=700344 RepID=A0AA37P5B0_9PEZI|nr:uncharacterized protein ColSpa_03477 [Colletotrichum spaethianum]GKT43296.1 hypothetical protein ColSpa_03477 [Colletotrichum spaethianum]
MPPYEAYRAHLARRYTESDASANTCSDHGRIVVALAVVSVLCAIGFFLAALYCIRFWKARLASEADLDSLNLTKQELAEVIKIRDVQCGEVRRLHKIAARYVLLHGRLPQGVLEQIAEENERASADEERAPAHSFPRDGPLPRHEDVFVVGSDEDEEDETRVRDSGVTNVSVFETDSAAPRVATTGVMHTAAQVSSA